MEWHEASRIYPMLSDDLLQELAADIRENGLLEPILIDVDDRIIDGRNRYAACKIAEVEPVFEVHTDADSIVSVVLSLNHKRRHLNKGQLAACAAKAEELMKAEREAAAERRKATEGRPKKLSQKVDSVSDRNDSKTVSRVAEQFGTNRQYVADARKIRDESPETLDRVHTGEITLQDAKREVRKQRQEKAAKTEPWPEDQERKRKALNAGEAVVVNVDSENHLTAYARARGLLVMVDRSSQWGNVFVLSDDGDRDDVCDAYARHYLPHKRKLQATLPSLKGKALGCHCSPKRCHADELARLANEI